MDGSKWPELGWGCALFSPGSPVPFSASSFLASGSTSASPFSSGVFLGRCRALAASFFLAAFFLAKSEGIVEGKALTGAPRQLLTSCAATAAATGAQRNTTDHHVSVTSSGRTGPGWEKGAGYDEAEL